VWDLPSGRDRVHSVAHLTGADWSGFGTVGFAPDGLYVGGRGGVHRLSLPADPAGTVTSETVYEAPLAVLNLSRDGTHLLVLGARKALGLGSLCEEMLLSSGLVDEAYTRYGLRTNRGGTYLATFRAVAKRYPHMPEEQILADLVKATPGEEGKWFAAAKELGLYDAAVQLARTSPCDPRTLARAARDHAADNPVFAVEAGCAALVWLIEGYGYEITGAEVWLAYSATMKAAGTIGRAAETKERIRRIVAGGPDCSFVASVLGRELGIGP